MNWPGITWSPSEASAVNEFLNTPVGRKWLDVLGSGKPQIDILNSDRAALTGAYAAGYEKVFLEIARTRIALQPEETASKSMDMSKD